MSIKDSSKEKIKYLKFLLKMEKIEKFLITKEQFRVLMIFADGMHDRMLLNRVRENRPDALEGSKKYENDGKTME